MERIGRFAERIAFAAEADCPGQQPRRLGRARRGRQVIGFRDELPKRDDGGGRRKLHLDPESHRPAPASTVAAKDAVRHVQRRLLVVIAARQVECVLADVAGERAVGESRLIPRHANNVAADAIADEAVRHGQDGKSRFPLPAGPLVGDERRRVGRIRRPVVTDLAVHHPTHRHLALPGEATVAERRIPGVSRIESARIVMENAPDHIRRIEDAAGRAGALGAILADDAIRHKHGRAACRAEYSAAFPVSPGDPVAPDFAAEKGCSGPGLVDRAAVKDGDRVVREHAVRAGLHLKRGPAVCRRPVADQLATGQRGERDRPALVRLVALEAASHRVAGCDGSARRSGRVREEGRIHDGNRLERLHGRRGPDVRQGAALHGRIPPERAVAHRMRIQDRAARPVRPLCGVSEERTSPHFVRVVAIEGSAALPAGLVRLEQAVDRLGIGHRPADEAADVPVEGAARRGHVTARAAPVRPIAAAHAVLHDSA